MPILILILFIILIVWGSVFVLKKAPNNGPRFLLQLGLLVAFLAFLLLAFTGRLPWLLGILVGLLPLAKRFLPVILISAIPFLKRVLSQSKPQTNTPGQQSDVTTNVLKMTLDHDSGEMDGEVLEGPHQGSMLSSLEFNQLKEIYQHCQNYDSEAARLLESYLQRHFFDQWQEESSGYNADNPSSEMTIVEALDILELRPNPSEEDIQKAHKRMMAKYHPDKGGSHYMAVRINQAKELLLSRR